MFSYETEETTVLNKKKNLVKTWYSLGKLWNSLTKEYNKMCRSISNEQHLKNIYQKFEDS